jgi:hypothetical protein
MRRNGGDDGGGSDEGKTKNGEGGVPPLQQEKGFEGGLVAFSAKEDDLQDQQQGDANDSGTADGKKDIMGTTDASPVQSRGLIFISVYLINNYVDILLDFIFYFKIFNYF